MRKSYQVALGGVLAALAIVIMMLGGLIPIATYVSPMLCALLLFFIKNVCGNKIGWSWYAAVSILSLLLSPDKEASAVFIVLGYYPILQPYFDKMPLQWLWKGLLFNGASAAMYLVLMFVFGMDQLLSEFQELGTIGLVIILLLGNVSFFLLDRLLHMLQKRISKRS